MLKTDLLWVYGLAIMKAHNISVYQYLEEKECNSKL